MTSQPFFRNTRTVASFSRAKLTLAMHPARNATRCVRSPSGGNVRPIWLKKNGGSAEGVSCWRSPRRPSNFNCPKPRASALRPLTSKR